MSSSMRPQQVRTTMPLSSLHVLSSGRDGSARGVETEALPTQSPKRKRVNRLGIEKPGRACNYLLCPSIKVRCVARAGRHTSCFPTRSKFRITVPYEPDRAQIIYLRHAQHGSLTMQCHRTDLVGDKRTNESPWIRRQRYVRQIQLP